MTIENEYKGYWFLPDSSDNKAAGILYNRKGEEVSLELIGCFETEISEILSFKPVNVIYGITHSNEKITLFNCLASGSWNLSSDYPITKYNCQYLIIGKHLSLIDEEIFNTIEIDMTYLYDWRPSSMIRQSVTSSKDSKIITTEFSLSNSDYWEEVIEINDNYNIKIHGTSEAIGSFDKRETKLTQNTLFSVNNTIAKSSFSTLLKLAGVFRQFLSLASLTSVEYSKIMLFDNNEFHELEDGRKRTIPTYLYYLDKGRDSVNRSKPNFLFNYTDIANVFPDTIRKWYNIKIELAPIRYHLIESIKFKRVFTSLDFLILVQALEGYHRRFVDKNNKKTITNLKDRITELIDLFNNVQHISKNLINVTQAVKSRNYYSHFYEDRTDVLEGIELYNLTNQLRILLICCVLRLIGFDNILIDKLIKQNAILRM